MLTWFQPNARPKPLLEGRSRLQSIALLNDQCLALVSGRDARLEDASYSRGRNLVREGKRPHEQSALNCRLCQKSSVRSWLAP